MKAIKGPYGGKIRNLYPKICSVCGKEFLVPKHFLKKQTMCSKECRGLSQRSRIVAQCSYCGSEIERTPSKARNAKSGLLFCNRKCKELATREKGKSFSGLRSFDTKYVRTSRGNVCEICNYGEYPQILVVHHKDSNRKNNEQDNLIVLCPNCHAVEHLVETEKGLVLRTDGIKRRLQQNKRG